MLQELEIKNFAILRNLKVSFDSGLNVLTGETGAGKTLVIDALEYVLGLTSFSDADVQAVFSPTQEALEFLKKNEFEVDEQLFLKRESKSGGKSVARINGTMVPVSRVKTLASLLMDVQGQHGHTTLLDKKAPLQLLDEYGGAAVIQLRNQHASLYAEWQNAQKQFSELSSKSVERDRKLELYRMEIQEIEEAKLQEGEEEALRLEREKLSQTEKLRQILEELEELANKTNFERISMLLEKLSQYEEKLQPWEIKLHDFSYEWTELKQILVSCREAFISDPRRVELIVNRLDKIHRLKNKFGSSIEEIFQLVKTKQKELCELETSDEDLEKLKTKIDALDQQLKNTSHTLSQQRKTNAQKLSEAVKKELQLLAIPDGQFQVRLEPLEKRNPYGIDHASFFVSLNPAEPLMPLEDIASGGELSRIMLVLKTLLASQDESTLVFDEVDAGIGGEAAFHVAERLRQLAQNRQVICVTHLHQVASKAEHHLRISKTAKQNETTVTVDVLSKEEKIRELARMMGGKQASEAAVKHAEELLRKRSR